MRSAEWFLVYVTGALVVGTLFLAWFTYRLWRATTEMVEKTSEESRDSATRMERSLAEAARAAAAMERLATAASDSAEAASAAASVSKRMLVAIHPPDIVVESAAFEGEADEPPTIQFWIENRGRSAATIETAYGMDWIREGPPTNSPDPAVYLQMRNVVGTSIAPGRSVRGDFPCQSIASHDIEVDLDAEGDPASPISDVEAHGFGQHRAGRRLFFAGQLGFTTETGERRSVGFRMECFPPGPDFFPQVLP